MGATSCTNSMSAAATGAAVAGKSKAMLGRSISNSRFRIMDSPSSPNGRIAGLSPDRLIQFSQHDCNCREPSSRTEDPPLADRRAQTSKVPKADLSQTNLLCGGGRNGGNCSRTALGSRRNSTSNGKANLIAIRRRSKQLRYESKFHSLCAWND